MLKRNLILGLASLVAIAVVSLDASAQDPSPRFGRWQMDSNNPPPSINIMT